MASHMGLFAEKCNRNYCATQNAGRIEMVDRSPFPPISMSSTEDNMGNYSKLIGSVVGGVIGWLGSKYALPQSLTSPEIQAAATLILSAVATYLFPANTASAPNTDTTIPPEPKPDKQAQ
jgi:hypothetical protein